MPIFRRNKDQSQKQESTHPYEVENELDLTREPATVRVKWSDNKVTYHKPGTDYTR